MSMSKRIRYTGKSPKGATYDGEVTTTLRDILVNGTVTYRGSTYRVKYEHLHRGETFGSWYVGGYSGSGHAWREVTANGVYVAPADDVIVCNAFGQAPKTYRAEVALAVIDACNQHCADVRAHNAERHEALMTELRIATERYDDAKKALAARDAALLALHDAVYRAECADIAGELVPAVTASAYDDRWDVSPKRD